MNKLDMWYVIVNFLVFVIVATLLFNNVILTVWQLFSLSGMILVFLNAWALIFYLIFRWADMVFKDWGDNGK